MAPAQWRQVEEIFDSALELAPPRRSAFLDQACAGDLLLRREVATLLAWYDRRKSRQPARSRRTVIRLPPGRKPFTAGRASTGNTLETAAMP